MELVCRNDASAFEIVLERHVDAAFSVAYRMVGRRSLAEDVVQEALLSLWRTGGRYDRSRGSVQLAQAQCCVKSEHTPNWWLTA